MFDVGFAELFLLALIGLLVLGPERLPGVARTVGGFVRKARTSWISLRNTIQSELNEADLAAPIKQTSDELKKLGKDLTDVQGLKPWEDEPADHESMPDDDKEEPSPASLKSADDGKDENA